MTDTATPLRQRLVTPGTKKVVKYGMVSGVSVVVTLASQFICLHFFGWQVRYATLTAAVCGAIPSYYLNRMWVWGKSGKSHMKREVIPFWVMFFVGLFFSLAANAFAVYLTDGMDKGTENVLVTASTFFSYGALWIGKYILFNKVLFASHPQDLDPVLDGRSGLPT